MATTTNHVPEGMPERSRARVRWGVALGVLVAFPLSYLLAYAAFLMAMLGLFFFVLFGLVIGAAMFRVWVPLRPLTPATIKLGVAVVVLMGWGGALVWEGVTFPADVAKEAIKQVIKAPGKTGHDVRADAAQSTREYLAREYPPGGVVGYWRWAMDKKTIEIPITGQARPKPICYNNNGWMFILRVFLCGVALTLAVYSMVAPLAKEPTSPTPTAEPADASRSTAQCTERQPTKG